MRFALTSKVRSMGSRWDDEKDGTRGLYKGICFVCSIILGRAGGEAMLDLGVMSIRRNAWLHEMKIGSSCTCLAYGLSPRASHAS